LVVYETPTRLPIPIFNEKALCALGRGLAKTGKLSPEGVKEALRSLARFVKLAEAMGVERLEAVGTAAVRDAEDGQAFLDQVEQACDLHVHVLSGAEEGRLAAVGLLNGNPGADGVLGDLGGGSLDLVGLDSGTVNVFATLPLGHLRLTEESDGNHQKAREILTERLAEVPWLADMNGRSLYAIGGSWRALARIFLDQTQHPLHVIDNFSIGFFDALRLSNLVSSLSMRTLEQFPDLNRRRMETLPFAAAALAGLIETAQPREVVFSAFGMREGQMLELLPPELRHQDPLISACESQAERTGRFAIHGQEILDWMTPLFPDETEPQRRLRLATCLLSDIGWSEHPDYRALHAYNRVLRVPYAGLTHPNRAEMALAVLVRYSGDPESRMVTAYRKLLDDEQFARAIIIGLALRLAHTLSGGAPDLLPQTDLKIKNQSLILELPTGGDIYLNEAVERRFKRLARAMDLKENVVQTEGKPKSRGEG
jgi:exopolyphosphatase/guanosine-5'-triphosphate,3'-diphosphate pyrophosphatase